MQIPKRSLIYLLLFLSIFSGVIFALLIALNQQAADRLTEYSLDRQLAIAKTGAISIESFIELSSRSLILLSQHYLLSEPDGRQQLLDDYIARRADTPVVEVAIINANGMLSAYSSRNGKQGLVASSQGIDLSQREYFTWAQTALYSESFVTQPTISVLGEAEDEYVLFIATPIGNDQFDGVMVTVILLKDFIDYYLRGYYGFFDVYLLQQNGVVITASPTERALVNRGLGGGDNIFEKMAQNGMYGGELLLDDLRGAVENTEDGGSISLIPNFLEEKLEKSLVAHAKINLKGQPAWTMITITPVEKAVEVLVPIYTTQLVIAVGIFFVLLLTSSVTIWLIHTQRL